MRRLALGLVAVVTIVALTMTWEMTDHPHWANIHWWPLGPGTVRPIDLLANAALYLPLGLAMPGRSWQGRLLAAGIAAAMLSVSLELTQVWSHNRVPSAADVIMNTAGAMIGAAVARLRPFQRLT